MKYLAFRLVCLVAIGCLLSSCSSGVFGDSSSSQTAAPVPGEKTGEEGMSATGGPGSAGVGTHW